MAASLVGQVLVFIVVILFTILMSRTEGFTNPANLPPLTDPRLGKGGACQFNYECVNQICENGKCNGH
jgi:hypothetical protein